MSSCKLVIKDEVNVKFENLSLEWRKRLSNKFKYEIPYARHLPAVKLGRWDGKVSFFGLGGTATAAPSLQRPRCDGGFWFGGCGQGTT